MNMQMRAQNKAGALAGKVALVTGSTSGIGLGIARSLAAAGASVVLNGFGPTDEIKQTQDAIADEFGVTVRYSAADMAKPDAIGGMIAMTLEEFGRLDVLVNNAGIQHVAPIDQFPVTKWDAILAINLSSAFHTIQHALPAMRKNGFGRIVNIVVCARADRVAVQGGLCRGQARHRRPHQGRRAGDRGGGHHLQRDLPGLRLHAAGRGADRRAGEGARHPARAGDPRRAARPAAEQAVRDRRRARRADRVSRKRSSSLDHRHRLAGRRRLDRALREDER